jgi:predicted permease
MLTRVSSENRLTPNRAGFALDISGLQDRIYRGWPLRGYSTAPFVDSRIPEMDNSERAVIENKPSKVVRELPIRFIMGTFLNDVQYGYRRLVSEPLFAGLAVATLALGIGANSAIFAVVNAVVLRPLPFGHPGRIVLVEDVIKKFSAEGMTVTPSDLIEYQRSTQSFASVAGFTSTSMDLTANGTPERVQGLRVSPEIFPVLGVSASLGRNFTSEEDRPGSGVAIISYRLWQSRFAGDSGVIGRVVEFDRIPTTIVGVLPKDFEFPLPGLPFGGGHEVWVPLGLTQEEQTRIGSYNYAVIARLKPGVNLGQAQADVQATARRIYESAPGLIRAGLVLNAQVSPVTDRVVQGSRKLLWLLVGAVGFVLLIACVNVANLLLGKSAGRQRELAIRSSLGASSAQLLRQLLTESLLLSAGGGVAGLVLAMWLVKLMERVIPDSVPRAATIDIDWHVIAFTAVVSLLVGLVFGGMPALVAARAGQAAQLKDASRGTTAGISRVRFRDLLVVTEVALSLMLLVGAGLLVRSLIALNAVNPGFDAQHVLTARITLPATAYPDAASARSFFQRAVDRFKGIPGATAAGASTEPLLSGRSQSLATVRDDPSVPSGLVVDHTVFGDYFQAAGVNLRRGRVFDSRDRGDSQPVVVINEAMARQYFPGKDPVGQQVKLGPPQLPAPWYTVIGVVADVKNNGLANNVRPQVYQAYLQLEDSTIAMGYGKSMVLAVKASSDPVALVSAVRSAMAQLDSQLPVADLETVRAQVESSLAPEWFQTGIVGSFAALALLLAAIGIYGVVSFAVTQRTPEIAVRMALGATRAGVLGLVIWQGMQSVLLGIGLGLGASLVLTRLMERFLFGVAPIDWITFSLAPFVLCIAALAANLGPAQRAASVDAMVALRYE